LRTLIAYRTKYGTAAACARILLEKIGGDTVLADLADVRDVNVREYDVVLVGGSIYAGKVQRTVVSFCERNRPALLQRRVGIFLCCLYQGENALVQLQSAFPDWLLTGCWPMPLPGRCRAARSTTTSSRSWIACSFAVCSTRRETFRG